MTSRKWLIAAAAVAATLSGCVAAPYYYDDYGYYGNGYDHPYYGYNNPYYAPPYYGPAYVAPPAVSFGFAYSSHEGHHGH